MAHNRIPIIIVEIQASSCSRVFGVAPCMATNGGDVTKNCFNTLSTCKDLPNYSDTLKSYRFSNGRAGGVVGNLTGGPLIPSVMSVEFAPTVLTPREGLGVRSSATITFQDHTYNDSGVDPYVIARGVDWSTRSTYWRRWLARNPYWETRPVKITTYFVDEDGVVDTNSIRNMSFILWAISGPDSQGTISMSVKDPLKLADGAKSQWPVKSNAFLTANIAFNATSFGITDPAAHVITAFNAGQPYAAMQNEIVLITSVAALGGGLYTVNATRATLPSFYPSPELNLAVEHKAKVNVQPCYLFNNLSPQQITYTLLNLGAKLAPTYLPLAEWDAEMAAAGMSDQRFSCLLCKPESVKELLAEISEHDLNMWWDERRAVVRFVPLQVFPPSLGTFDERKNMLADSVQFAQSISSRISQSWVYYALRWPLGERDKLESYASVEAIVDQPTEQPSQFGSPSIQATYSRWLTISTGSLASAIATRTVLRYRYGRASISFTIDLKDDYPWTGDTMRVQSCQFVDDNGKIVTALATITQAQFGYSAAGFSLSYIADATLLAGINNDLRTARWADAAVTMEYGAASPAQRLANAFICSDTGLFADGSTAYTLQG